MTYTPYRDPKKLEGPENYDPRWWNVFGTVEVLEQHETKTLVAIYIYFEWKGVLVTRKLHAR